MQSLTGKTALITGSAKRLGRATAEALADEGVNIIVHYNTSSDEADELAEMLRQKGVNAWTVKADFTRADEYETLIERSFEAAGSIDFLINNASIFPKGKLEDIKLEDVGLNVEVNAWAPLVLSRAFASKAGKGKIINFLDTRITGYDWLHAAYYLSKHMLSVLTRMTALLYAPDITVNAVAPGLILPPEGQDESYLDRLTYTVPMKKHGEARDVAEAIVFLLKSDFITGQVIYVDGGRHLKEAVDG